MVILTEICSISLIIFGLVLIGLIGWIAISLQSFVLLLESILEAMKINENFDDAYVLTDYGRRLVEALGEQNGGRNAVEKL